MRTQSAVVSPSGAARELIRRRGAVDKPDRTVSTRAEPRWRRIPGPVGWRRAEVGRQRGGVF
jgi:hypothetical protein